MLASSTLRLLTAGAVVAGALVASPTDALAAGADKAGPFMINGKVGPAIEVDDFPTQFALQLEFAYAVDRKERAYIGFNPQFQFADFFTLIQVPFTFQYDIPLPPKGLFIYPKINAGVAFVTQARDGAYFTLQPEFGIKYQIHENFHVCGEPFSLPFYLGETFAAQYRLWFGAGADF